MSNLKEQVNKTAEILNDIKSALADQGVDTTGMTPKDYANAVRGVVNDITVESVGLIPVLVFKYNETRPNTPDGGSWNSETGEVFSPEGWFTDIDQDYKASNKLLPLWMSTAVFSSAGELYKKWSTPVRISGKDGENGERGPAGLDGTVAGVTQYFNTPIFFRGTSARPDTPKANYDPLKKELTISTGWTETINIEDTDKYVFWQSYVKYNTQNNPTALCTSPIRMSAESSVAKGNVRWYKLSNDRNAPAKGGSGWTQWQNDADIAPTRALPYLYCYDETIYSESNKLTSPVYLLTVYTEGLLDINLSYAVGQENTVRRRDSESEGDYENRFGRFWFESSVDAISVHKTDGPGQHPDDSDHAYYPGLTEKTQFLWCRETFVYADRTEDFYRVISYYKAAEKAPILYSAGVYNDLILYIKNEEQCPYVFYPAGLYLDENENVLTKEKDGKDVPVTDEDAPQNGKKYQYFFLKNSYENLYDSFFDAYQGARWKKIDSFEAIYSDIGIFKSALVGKFVFDDKYLFSQFGKDGNSGKIEQLYTDYTDTKGKVYDYEQGVEKDRTGVAVAIEDPNATKKFIPATLINAVTGESWFGNGTTKFYSNGEGDLANGAIGWRLESGKTEPTLYIDGDVKIGTRAPKPGAGPLESKSFNERLNEQDEKIKSSIQEVQDQIDGVIENWNGIGAPSIKSSPTLDWINNENKNLTLLSHINDTYINVGPYESTDSDGNVVIDETAGQAWRWCQCDEDSVETESITLSGYIGAPSTRIPIGTLPIKLNYTGNVRVYKNDQLLGTISISSLGNAGTINGLQIRTTTYGLVTIIDTTSNGANVGNIDVEFEYYDYIQVKDNEDNVLNLHWHKIADSDAVRALKEATEATRIAKESATPLNLLANSAEITTWNSDYTYNRIPLPILVSAGEQYTFKCESAELLAGTHTGFRLKIDDGTDANNWTPWSDVITFGENKTITLTINSGVSNKKASLTLYKESYPDNYENTAVFHNVSLVKGTVAMPMWQDYQGDNGLKNLLTIDSTYNGNFTAHTYYGESLPAMKAGEQYTFCISNISTNGTKTQISAVIDNEDTGKVITNRCPIYLNKGTQWGTFTITEDCATPRILIENCEGPNTSLTANITGFSLVKGTRPMMVWKGNDDITYLKNTFGTVTDIDGVTLSKAVAVKDENGKVTGILNGTNEWTNDSGASLILAAGADGASNVNTASTRIYADGTGHFTGSINATGLYLDFGKIDLNFSINGESFTRSQDSYLYANDGQLVIRKTTPGGGVWASGQDTSISAGKISLSGGMMGAYGLYGTTIATYSYDVAGQYGKTSITNGTITVKNCNNRINETKTEITGGVISCTTLTANHTIKGYQLEATNGVFDTSDARLKDFENKIEVDLDVIKNIPKTYFRWKDNPENLNIGTSAQEVQKIYPELVSTNDKGELSVSYSKLSIIALAAIDKLHEENIELKDRLNKLEELYGNRR